MFGPGEDALNLKGGVAGGSILQGVLRVGDEVEVRPGIVTKDASGQIKYDNCPDICVCADLIMILLFPVPHSVWWPGVSLSSRASCPYTRSRTICCTRVNLSYQPSLLKIFPVCFPQKIYSRIDDGSSRGFDWMWYPHRSYPHTG